MNTADTTTHALQDISIEEQAQLDGGGLTGGETIGIGMGMIGLGLGIAAATGIGAIGIGAAFLLSAFGGSTTGTGINMVLKDS